MLRMTGRKYDNIISFNIMVCYLLNLLRLYCERNVKGNNLTREDGEVKTAVKYYRQNWQTFHM